MCCNCGALPSWYAARSDDPAENLAKVFLEPVIPKYGGGGAHFAYVCREGEITVARMSRVDGKYHMFIARGEFVDFPREKMAETCSAWPHGYIRLDIRPKDFLEVFQCEPCACSAGRSGQGAGNVLRIDGHRGGQSRVRDRHGRKGSSRGRFRNFHDTFRILQLFHWAGTVCAMTGLSAGVRSGSEGFQTADFESAASAWQISPSEMSCRPPS